MDPLAGFCRNVSPRLHHHRRPVLRGVTAPPSPLTEERPVLGIRVPVVARPGRHARWGRHRAGVLRPPPHGSIYRNYQGPGELFRAEVRRSSGPSDRNRALEGRLNPYP